MPCLTEWLMLLSSILSGKQAEEEIRCIFDDNLGIILPNLHKNLCCGCSLESPR